MVARYSMIGDLYWLKVVQDTEFNLATGITMVHHVNNIVYAVGGYESDN